MMEFPRFVFKNKGPLQRPGGSFDQHLVVSQSEMTAAVKAGWYATLPEAIEDKPVEEEHDDNSAPTRAELEAKAKDLGIEFSPKIGDAKLGERIQAALDAQAKAAAPPEV